MRRFHKDENITDTVHGKIRYIGGFVIAKLWYRNNVKFQRSANRTDKVHVWNYEHGKHCLYILDSLRATEWSLLTSKYSGSLEETRCKQNIGSGLTNITDSAYELLEVIMSTILTILSAQNVTIHGSDLYTYVKQTLIND